VFSRNESASYSLKADVYSYGLCLWEMWERRRPYFDMFSHFDIIEAIMAGIRPEISPSCPPTIAHLIQQCCQSEPLDRPSFRIIVQTLKDELQQVKSQAEPPDSMWGKYGKTAEEEARLRATGIALRSPPGSPSERSSRTGSGTRPSVDTTDSYSSSDK